MTKSSPFKLTEANIWPSPTVFPSHSRAEALHTELQSLSKQLLSLLASSLDLPSTYFDTLLTDSVSTLRFLHYPTTKPPAPRQELSCTPHTDSGLLTLLHQDAVSSSPSYPSHITLTCPTRQVDSKSSTPPAAGSRPRTFQTLSLSTSGT